MESLVTALLPQTTFCNQNKNLWVRKRTRKSGFLIRYCLTNHDTINKNIDIKSFVIDDKNLAGGYSVSM